MSDGAAPMCNSCGHAHHEGQKCSVCGHTGKGKSYRLIPKTSAPTCASLHFEIFDKQIDPVLWKTQWALARLLRIRVDVDECHISMEQEFDTFDNDSRHMIGLVGDAPVLYARWRFQKETMGLLAVIDRMLVLQSHRGRRYSIAGLQSIKQDILLLSQQSQRHIAGIVAPVPLDQPLVIHALKCRHFEQVGQIHVDEKGRQIVSLLHRS